MVSCGISLNAGSFLDDGSPDVAASTHVQVSDSLRQKTGELSSTAASPSIEDHQSQHLDDFESPSLPPPGPLSSISQEPCKRVKPLQTHCSCTIHITVYAFPIELLSPKTPVT